MRDNPLLAAALGYAARGWAVFPVWWPEGERCACGKGGCDSPGKHPLWHPEDLPSGRNSATTDPELIRRWWTRWPKANIGIATGPESGLVVVDIDPRHNGHPDRLPGNLPLTPTVNTGGGGWHSYFAHPGDGFKFPPKLPNCPGADLKAAGGYVVAPPALHISGRRYTWEIPPTHPLAPCPAWLLEVAKRPEPRPRAPLPAAYGGALGTAYGRAALAGELARLAQAPEGDRNNALNRAAFGLGKLLGAGHLDERTVTSLLATVGTNTGLSPREIERTLASGLRAGREVAHV